jgi:GTP-binding protein
LQLNLKPIVLINKIDRPDATIETTRDQISDLFLDLATSEGHLEFPILYGSGKLGFVNTDPAVRAGTMEPLFDAIISHIPAPKPKGEHLQLLITSLDHSDFLGPIAIGRIFSGSCAQGMSIIQCKDDQISTPTKITRLFTFLGLTRKETAVAPCGDIVAVTGFDRPPVIGTTLCDPEFPAPYPYVKIDEPTLSMFFSVNDSPFAGKEGTFLTSRNLKDRLQKELRTNVALRVEETDSPEVIKVSGRGQLHLGILIETMRREGFELQVSAPEVINRMINGVLHEPIEFVVIDVPVAYQGVVMEMMGMRKAIMKILSPLPADRSRLEYQVPSRALLGFRGEFLTSTRGTGVVTMSFFGYEPHKGDIPTRIKGALVSMEHGPATGYALDTLQERGVLFVKPGDPIYDGMIIGEHSRANDLTVNPCKEKKLTNMRASGTDEAVRLPPPRIMDLETCIEWIRPDELIEVTPLAIRLRKKPARRK